MKLELNYNELNEIEYALQLLANQGKSSELTLLALSKITRMRLSKKEDIKR